LSKVKDLKINFGFDAMLSEKIYFLTAFFISQLRYSSLLRLTECFEVAICLPNTGHGGTLGDIEAVLMNVSRLQFIFLSGRSEKTKRRKTNATASQRIKNGLDELSRYRPQKASSPKRGL
jgi:hypothetical protein